MNFVWYHRDCDYQSMLMSTKIHCKKINKIKYQRKKVKEEENKKSETTSDDNK